jgi:hypothetical protein
MALYTNFMHIAAPDGSGIMSVADLRGKRVSIGAPGSGAAPDTKLRLSFSHSMYGSPVEEIFQVHGDGFHLILLRYSERREVDFYGYGSAKFVGGAWIVTPKQRIFPPGPARESGSLNEDRLNLAA